MPGMDYWMISTGPMGKSLGGGMYKKQDANQHPTNYVQVESVDEAVQRLQQAGGSMVMPKQEIMGMGFTALGLDPEGNPVGLWQALRPSGRAKRVGSKRVVIKGKRIALVDVSRIPKGKIKKIKTTHGGMILERSSGRAFTLRPSRK